MLLGPKGPCRCHKMKGRNRQRRKGKRVLVLKMFIISGSVCEFLYFFGRFLFSRFFDRFLFFCQDDFNMTRIGHVRVDATVSSVGTSSHFRCFVDLYVVNLQGIRIQLLELRVALGISQKVQDVLTGFLWKAPNTVVVLFEERVSLRMTANSIFVATKWDC